MNRIKEWLNKLKIVRYYKRGNFIAGIDYESGYKCIIGKINRYGNVEIVNTLNVPTIDSLEMILKRYKVKIVVINALPDTREVRKLCNTLENGFMCYFHNEEIMKIDRKDKTSFIRREALIKEANSYIYELGEKWLDPMIYCLIAKKLILLVKGLQHRVKG